MKTFLLHAFNESDCITSKIHIKLPHVYKKIHLEI